MHLALLGDYRLEEYAELSEGVREDRLVDLQAHLFAQSGEHLLVGQRGHGTQGRLEKV